MSNTNPLTVVENSYVTKPKKGVLTRINQLLLTLVLLVFLGVAAGFGFAAYKAYQFYSVNHAVIVTSITNAQRAVDLINTRIVPSLNKIDQLEGSLNDLKGNLDKFKGGDALKNFLR